MESNAMCRTAVAPRRLLVVLGLLGATLAQPASAWAAPAGRQGPPGAPVTAQPQTAGGARTDPLVVSIPSVRTELTGSWNLLPEWVSNDTVPVDYTGLPLTDEGRARALSYSEAQLGMVERQCEGWSASYVHTGPFGLKIWAETDPTTAAVVSYTIGAWVDRLPMVIWMDGRPHPSALAEHTRGGFTTGRWEGTTLVAYTTHMQDGFLRKNGPPASDRATMTTRFYRHGEYLMVLGLVEDPFYLAEPLIWTRNYRLSLTALATQVLPCTTTFEGTPSGDVPHYLPGRKPFVSELTDKYGIPRDAVLGFPETLYPEYKQRIRP